MITETPVSSHRPTTTSHPGVADILDNTRGKQAMEPLRSRPDHSARTVESMEISLLIIDDFKQSIDDALFELGMNNTEMKLANRFRKVLLDITIGKDADSALSLADIIKSKDEKFRVFDDIAGTALGKALACGEITPQLARYLDKQQKDAESAGWRNKTAGEIFLSCVTLGIATPIINYVRRDDKANLVRQATLEHTSLIAQTRDAAAGSATDLLTVAAYFKCDLQAVRKVIDLQQIISQVENKTSVLSSEVQKIQATVNHFLQQLSNYVQQASQTSRIEHEGRNGVVNHF